jgi:hypothetical protein
VSDTGAEPGLQIKGTVNSCIISKKKLNVQYIQKSTKINKTIFLLDRRNDKIIINLHTQVEESRFEPLHDVRPNNFEIFFIN